MSKPQGVTIESLVDGLNNTGPFRFGFFNSNREYKDRVTGQTVKSIFANVSLQNTLTGERWFINRVGGAYVAKKAGAIAPKKPTPTSTPDSNGASSQDLNAIIATAVAAAMKAAGK